MSLLAVAQHSAPAAQPSAHRLELAEHRSPQPGFSPTLSGETANVGPVFRDAFRAGG